MTKVVKTASPAAIAALKQATKLWPKRSKKSDGLLPSAAHQKQNPKSDHNTGLAIDLTHDPANGVDCADIFEKLKKDKRVDYLIFNKKIWNSRTKIFGSRNRVYNGINPHSTHLHISIRPAFADDVSDWYPWVDKKLPQKVKAVCTCTTCPVHKKGTK